MTWDDLIEVAVVVVLCICIITFTALSVSIAPEIYDVRDYPQIDLEVALE